MNDLPTVRSTLEAEYVHVLLTCWSCKHADLEGLANAGRGDMPLVNLRWRYAKCRSRRVDFVVTAKLIGPKG